MRALLLAVALSVGVAVPAHAVTDLKRPDAPHRPAPKPAPKPHKPKVNHDLKRRKAAVAFVRRQVGKPYSWGAIGPNSFDCSGLTYTAYKRKIPRTSGAQLAWGRKIRNLRIGDLVFRGSGHVGMYVGKGMAVHATKPGNPVKYITVGYFTSRRAVR